MENCEVNGCYSRCYHVMAVSDMLQESGVDFDCYEDMWGQSHDIYDDWVDWDISNPKITDKMAWIESFLEYLTIKGIK